MINRRIRRRWLTGEENIGVAPESVKFRNLFVIHPFYRPLALREVPGDVPQGRPLGDIGSLYPERNYPTANGIDRFAQ